MTLQILRKGHVQKEKCVKEWNHNYTQCYGTKRGPTTWNHVNTRKHDFKKKWKRTFKKRRGYRRYFHFLWRSGKLAAISEARTKKQPEGPQITLPNQRVSVTIGKRKQTSSICHFGEPTTRVFILVSFAFMQIGKSVGRLPCPVSQSKNDWFIWLQERFIPTRSPFL